MDEEKCEHYSVPWEYYETNNCDEAIYTGICDDCKQEVEKAVTTITTEEVYLR